MDINQYLRNLLSGQKLTTEDMDKLELDRSEVEKLLLKHFSDPAPVIKYAGSKAKGTMIAESYDLDIVCYFPSTEERTLREIREDVRTALEKKYAVQDKATSLRIRDEAGNDYHVDVVPGRFTGPEQRDAFLYVLYGDKERIQTNIKVHIKYIVESGCQDAIKLIKLWGIRNNLEAKTFVLELATVRALEDMDDKDNLGEALTKVFELLSKLDDISLVDPANSNNDVTNAMDSSHKALVAQAAEFALSLVIESGLNGWKKVFCDEEVEPASQMRNPINISIPSKPWCW